MRQGERYTAGNRDSGRPRTAVSPAFTQRRTDTVIRPKPPIDRRESQTVALPEVRSKGRLWRWLATATGLIALSVLCIARWQLTQKVTAEAPAPTPIPRALPRDPDDALSKALDRLDSALASVPGSNPQAALRKASAPDKGCMIIWTNGLPSLLFGQEPVLPNSLARIVENCAEAVSSTH